MIAISLVVPTLGRSTELLRFFDSVEASSRDDVEIIVVDQNDDERLTPIMAAKSWTFRLLHIRTPKDRGISRARNVGWRHAVGDVVAFPDDDCWYPNWLIKDALAVMQAQGADIVTGRAADDDGRPINGRFATRAQAINRSNVFETQIEWVAFFKRRVLEAVGGFSEDIGIGAASPWQSCEGQDIVLRAIKAGFGAHFDPALFGHHAELDIYAPDISMQRKGRIYGRGMGAVLRRHRFSIINAGYRLVRSGGLCILQTVRMNRPRARYYANVTLGRLEGYIGRTFD